jgi:hypothetical protein
MALKSVQNLKDIAGQTLNPFEFNSGGKTSQGTIRDQLFDTAERTTAQVQEKATAAGQIANQAFDTTEGIAERQERAITGGAGRDARQERSSKRKLGLARALADVNARNLNVRGQRQEIRTAQGSLTGLRNITESQQGGAAGSLAGDETTRQIDHQKALAAFAKKKAGGIGAIAGFAANFIPVVGPLVAPIVKSVVTSAAA